MAEGIPCTAPRNLDRWIMTKWRLPGSQGIEARTTGYGLGLGDN